MIPFGMLIYVCKLIIFRGNVHRYNAKPDNYLFKFDARDCITLRVIAIMREYN